MGVAVSLRESPFFKRWGNHTLKSTMKERMTVTQKTPHKTKIAASLSVILGAGLAAPIYAQESAESTEEEGSRGKG